MIAIKGCEFSRSNDEPGTAGGVVLLKNDTFYAPAVEIN